MEKYSFSEKNGAYVSCCGGCWKARKFLCVHVCVCNKQTCLAKHLVMTIRGDPPPVVPTEPPLSVSEALWRKSCFLQCSLWFLSNNEYKLY